MERFTFKARFAGLAACSAMAAVLLVGCSAHAPLASSGSPAISGESADAQMSEAIAKAEKRVAKSPQSASARVDLAQAYLTAGRFYSSATTFQDAMSLGEKDPRVALGLALSYIGSGRNAEALSLLSSHRADIPVSDLGLALALAGQPGQAVGLLSDAVRSGNDNPKTRQNLAYAYALNGRWAEARVVASQDVPADQIDARMSEWAASARPEQFQVRVAGLLGAPVRADSGQPAALALNGAARDDTPRMAVADLPVPTPIAPVQTPEPATAELPPVATRELAAATEDDFQQAFKAEPASAPASAPVSLATNAAEVAKEAPVALASRSIENPKAVPVRKFVSQPTVQSVSAAHSAYVDAPQSATHLVQLGSFSTLEGAKRAWGIFVARNPKLKDHTMRITEADVRGRRYYRVAAEGFDRGTARNLCSSVRERGGGCFAYAKTHTLPGTIPGKSTSGAMLASL